MRVDGFESPALSIVTNRAAEVRKFVPALPLAVFLRVSQSGRVTMRLQRLRVSLETRIVGGDVAGRAAVHARIAELGHDDLLDLQLVRIHRRFFRVGLRQAASLLPVRRLMLLPAIEKLVVENDPVHNQHYKTCYSQRNSRTHRILLVILFTTERRTPSWLLGRMCQSQPAPH